MNDFLILSIDQFGHEVFRHIHQDYEKYPIFNKCQNVNPKSTLLNSLKEFDSTFLPDFIDSLKTIEKLQMACIVGNLSDGESWEICCNLASVINGQHSDAAVFAITPDTLYSFNDPNIDMVIKPSPAGIDSCTDFQFTFYNTYRGCGQLGNLQCLKAHLEDVLAFRQSKVFSASAEAEIFDRTIFDNMMQKILNDISVTGEINEKPNWYGIFEIPHNHSAMLECYGGASDYLNDYIDIEYGILAHAGLNEGHYKLTVFQLYSMKDQTTLPLFTKKAWLSPEEIIYTGQEKSFIENIFEQCGKEDSVIWISEGSNFRIKITESALSKTEEYNEAEDGEGPE